MTPAIQFAPHAEALRLIEGKPAMVSRVFYDLLPELRARAFTVAGVENIRTLQRVKRLISQLASGEDGLTFPQIQQRIAAELEPVLEESAATRATLVLRANTFVAFQSALWDVIQADADTTHIQYIAVDDERTRPAHAALDGLVLTKDDPFWQTHYPPWDWGCRCMVRPINPDLLEEIQQADTARDPDQKLIVTGPRLRRMRDGQLARDGQVHDVTPPSLKPGAEHAWRWSPGDMRLTVEEIQRGMDADEWRAFARWARDTEYAPGRTVWSWISQTG